MFCQHLQAALLLFGCAGDFVIGIDFGLFWTDLLAADWWYLVEAGLKCCFGEWFLWILWWIASDFGFFVTFLAAFYLVAAVVTGRLRAVLQGGWN